MRRWWGPWVILFAVCASGCAGYRVQRDGEGPGYDVYAPEPYLLGSPKVVDPQGGKFLAYDFTVIWLPNYTKRYRVTSWAGLGKANFTFMYSEGWKLTQVNDASDNTAILQNVIDLVKHVLPADTFHLARDKRGLQASTDVQPILYGFDYDAAGRVCGLRRVKPPEPPARISSVGTPP